KVRKWARLRLPNSQIARSAWKETLKPLDKLRMSRNVKFRDGDEYAIGEVQYFCWLKIGEDTHEEAVALISVYSAPDATLLEESYGAVYLGPRSRAAFKVVSVKQIKSVVAMVP
ncbi:hypothetical protein LXA43DRAFT_874110, partial [Ganoderma leucocontextum]